MILKEELIIKTQKKEELVDITTRVKELVAAKEISDGICQLFVPHTTAGIVINENADPDVAADILSALNMMLPSNYTYRHLEGNAEAHVKSCLIGSSANIFISNKQLVLGTWQGIFFCEFDGPRKRQVYVKIVKG